jgi:hypothetical protein
VRIANPHQQVVLIADPHQHCKMGMKWLSIVILLTAVFVAVPYQQAPDQTLFARIRNPRFHHCLRGFVIRAFIFVRFVIRVFSMYFSGN